MSHMPVPMRDFARPPEGMVPLAFIKSPIAGDADFHAFPKRMTLAEIIAAVPDLPDAFHRWGMVTVHQGSKFSVVDRSYWSKGATKRLWLTGSDESPVMIRLHFAPGKSAGGKGGKSVLTIVATLALLAVGAFITGGGLVPLLGPALAAGSTFAQAAAFAVTFVGRLALALIAKPAANPTNDQNQAPPLGQAGASGNSISPGSSFYYCAGRTKVFPQFASAPLVDLSGNDEVVEASYMLSGPHDLQNIKVEDTPISEIDGLTYVYNFGTESIPQSLLARYGIQRTPQYELKAHSRDKTTGQWLEHQSFPANDIPKPHSETSKTDPDEIWLQLLWPGGLSNAQGTLTCVMPLRLRMKNLTTGQWFNLPELWFHSSLLGRISKMVVLTWATPPSVISDQAYTNGAWNSFHTVPNQTVTPAGQWGWNAHSSFVGGANFNAVARVERRQDRFIVYLDPTVFVRGARWQIEASRGAIGNLGSWANQGGTFNPTLYRSPANTDIYSPFGYITVSGVSYTMNGNFVYNENVTEACILMRFSSVWNKKPMPLGGDATIEIRGRNINVGQISCEASALIKTWNGTAFDGLQASDDPADHLYNLLAGALTAEPIPDKYIDVPALAAWRADNQAAGRKVSMVIDERDWWDSCQAVAAAGLAQAVAGRFYTVVRQRDTKTLGILPKQVFTHLNTFNLTFTKPFSRVPDAARVSFRNRALDWDQDELLVLRPGVTAAEINTIVNMDAVGIADSTMVQTYFKLYLAASWYRDHQATFETWFEGMGAVKGDIIGINDINLESLMTSARIVSVSRNGSNEVVSIAISVSQDGRADQSLDLLADLSAVSNLLAQGEKMGCAIGTGTGVATQPLSAVSAGTKTLTFQVPFVNDAVKPGQAVAIGRVGFEYLRWEIVDITPGDELRHTVTVVPEAPEMWAA